MKKKIVFSLAFICLLPRNGKVQPATELPEDSTAFWKVYQPGVNTLALFQFDQPQPEKDSSGQSENLIFPPGIEIGDGKFGQALEFKPGHQPVKINLGQSLFAQERFIIDFWFKPEKIPEKGEVFLLFKEHQFQKSNGFSLGLTQDGALVWRHRTLVSSEKSHPEWFGELRSPEKVVKVGHWHHVAIYVGAFSHVYQSDNAYLWLDGKVVSQIPHGWRYINYHLKEEGKTSFCLGGNPKENYKFLGKIDQFRVLTGIYRQFYPIPDESFVDPDNMKPLPEDPRFFASKEEILFKAGFDGTLKADLAREKSEPVKAPRQVQFSAGVKGQSLLLPSGHKPVAYAAKGNINPAMGAIEMWVKPLGWQQLGTKLQWFFWTDNNGPTFLIPNTGFWVAVTGGAENREVEYPADTWIHFVLTWADRQIRLYANGEEKLSAFLPNRFEPEKDFGLFGPGSGKPMLVDELTIYSRPLSSGEVKNHYRRYFGKNQFTKLPEVDCLTTFFQGVGKILGVAYFRKRPFSAGSLTVKLENGREILAEKQGDYFPNEGGLFLLENLPVPLPPGKNYTLSLFLQSKETGEKVIVRLPFSFTPYPWLGNTLGLEPRVLKPWTPMKEKNQVIQVVGRQYTLGQTGLFSRLTNQGQEMLAAPMRIEAVSAGETTLLAGTGVKVFKRQESQVAWHGSGRGEWRREKLSVRIEGMMEYDGHTLLTFTFFPEGKETRLDRLSLVIPLKEEFARLYLTLFGVGLPHGVGGFLPYGQLPTAEGMIFSSKTWYEYLGWDGLLQTTGIFDFRQATEISERKLKLVKRWKPTLGNFIPQLWIGNDELGLAYMADNDRGWVATDGQSAITLERKGSVVEWKFNFISTPFNLKEARQVTLSFQATPEKPQPPNWRKHFWRGPKRNDSGITCQWLSDSAGWDEAGVGPYPYNPKGSKAAVEKMHSEGLKVTPHLDTSSLNWGGKTVREFQAEWDSGGVQYNQIFTRSKIDFAVWSHKKWKDQYGIDGVYFDTGTPRPNYNTISGTAYYLPDGRIQPGWTMFGQREYYKRSAHIFGNLGTECFSWSCGYTGPQIAGWQWAAVPGGEYRIDYAMDYYPGPFDLMRILSNSGKFGTIMMWMGLSEYVKKNEAPENYEKFFRHMYAMMLPLDSIWAFGSFVHPKCLQNFSIADPEVKFAGFWKNPFVSYLSPAEEVITSVYYKPDGRALLILSNLGCQPQSVPLRVHTSKLNLDVQKTEVTDGEKEELPKPKALTTAWHYWINRGGASLISDDQNREIRTQKEKDSLLIEVFIPGHDYRLVLVQPR
ncbi:MAG: LamG domain-containing protein [Candidatus Omnitrophica bacterium]|nr:LamG domain-containing protein [Candidatus Omnitrophota bacterium]